MINLRIKYILLLYYLHNAISHLEMTRLITEQSFSAYLKTRRRLVSEVASTLVCRSWGELSNPH